MPATLPTVDLRTLDDEAVTLQSHVTDRPLLVLAMRYYGCLPCQHYLVDLHERRDDIAALGVDVIVVGVAANFQARHLEATYGIEFPMLLDPDQNLYRALELRKLRLVDFLFPRTWKRYIPLFVRRYLTRQVSGPKQGKMVGDAMQLPGLAILDADGSLRWVHRGQGLGDYPPVDALLDTIRQLNLPEEAASDASSA